MKRGIIVALILLCAITGSGCCIGHEYTPATCATAATCVKCGETEGEALGHDYADATCMTEKKCRTCGMTEGVALGHQWESASCTEAKKCSVCGVTDGEPLGHSWVEATCITSTTCSVCQLVDGLPLGHTVEQWRTDKEPTCTEKGTESGACSVCEETVQREIEMTEHREGEWVTTVMPTKESKGTRCVYCEDCNKTLKTEQFSLTPEELEELYKKQCKSISYDSLSRTPGDYEGEYVKFSGKVVQVCSEAESSLYYSTYRVATSGSYKNVVYICVDNYGSGRRILEDDRITFYGTFGGLYTYKTVMGASLTIPKIYVEYID